MQAGATPQLRRRRTETLGGRNPMDRNSLTRRQFIHIGTGAVAATAAAKVTLLEPHLLSASARAVPPSDTVRFASIGTGIRGCELLQASLRVPGIECVGVCDLYDARHDAGKEAVKKDVPATRDYRTILDRKDVDAVIVAVTDHQHRKVVADACAAGKDVYCEKPMSHTVDDEFAMIDAARKANRIMQIGSQRVSSILYEKAKDIYDSGRLGDVFVHLISGIHFITSTNTVAQRAQSSGGIFRWKDGREFPDLIETLYDYPNFRVVLRCNLNNEGGEFIAFYGTKGTMVIKDSTLTYKPQNTRPQAESYSIYGWPAKLRNEYLKKWHEENPLPTPLNFKADEEAETFATPPGYNDVSDHQTNFFNAVRSRKPTVENEVFGNNAAIGCHLSNFAYFNKDVAVWDPAAKKIIKD